MPNKEVFMGIHLSRATLDKECQPYPITFSSSSSSQSIKEYAFPIQKGRTTEGCDAKEWYQKGSQCSFVHNGEQKDIFENRSHLTSDQVVYYKTPAGIVDLNSDGIEMAIEKRVALFFQQAILCYKMSDFIFYAEGADAQIGSSPAIKLSSSQSHFIMHKREAAHSSTIPTLRARAKDGSTPNGIVYLKGGSSYYQHNATIGMHESVNGADELIDGKGQDGKLRDIAIKILNEVAEGLDPVQATEKFCGSFKAQVVASSATLEPCDNRKAVLNRYHELIARIQQAAVTNKAFYDKLIGVIIDPTKPYEKVLREIIYQKRYEVIRLQETVESRVGKRIDDAKALMKSNDTSLIEYLLLKEFSEKESRTVLEKLFGKTMAFLEKEYQVMDSSLKAFRTRVTNLTTKYKDILSHLERDLRSDFRKLSSDEFTYRAGVFHDLRDKVHHWTQKKFQEMYQAVTGISVTQPWVSRMEQLSRLPTKETYKTPLNQRRRYITVEEGMNCAATFGVDAGLFLPCLFTSV